MESPKMVTGGSPDDGNSGEASTTPLRSDLKTVAMQYLQTEAEQSRTIPTRHVLVTASYLAEKANAVPSSAFSDAAIEAMLKHDVEPVGVASYTTHVFIRPQHSMIDAWTALTNEERQELHDRFPQLYTAIFLLFKATVPEEPSCESLSDKGTSCVVKDEHDVHHASMTDQPTEVWR